MAKAKKTAPSKLSKRRKAVAKPNRKKISKQTSPKRVKAKARPGPSSPLKSIAKNMQALKTVAKKPLRKAPRQAVKSPVEETNNDTIHKPMPSAVRSNEYEMVRVPTSEPKPAPEADADDSEAPKQ